MNQENLEKKYPVRLEVDYPVENSKTLALLGIPFFFIKLVFLFPHMVILYFLNIASLVAVWISYWAILFTGKYPKGFFRFVVGVMRWQARVNAWLYSLTDKYPPFDIE